jgi:hypothetical protein
MKKLLGMIATVGLVALAACSMKVASSSRRANSDPLILRFHFVGSEKLWAAPESAKFKELVTVNSSAALRDEIINRFALLPSFWLKDSLPTNTGTQTNLFRPIFEDLLTHECYFESGVAPEVVIAAQVPEARARLWQTNLWQALVSWKFGTPAAAKFDGFSGFELKRTTLPAVVRCIRAGDWMVVSAGSGKSARESEMLVNIRSSGRPAKLTGAWLDGDANLARLDGWLPALSNFENLPVAHFSMSNRADFVRTYATLDFPKPHGWKPEPWHIPTNAIHEPLVDFTAVRGVAPIFDSFKSIRDLGYKPTPNQFVGWGYGNVPFQYNYAAPSQDVRDQLKRIETNLQNLITGPGHLGLDGFVTWGTNSQDIVWRGLLGAVPHLGAFRDAGREYLALSAFPPLRGSNPPPQLYEPFKGRDELVAFDFELTALRVPHWRQFYQILEVANRRPLGTTNAPFQKWLLEATRQFGEAVTEVRVTSPAQMTFVRKSSIGLTAVELVTLGRWLESSEFPAYGVFQPVPARRPGGTAKRPQP